MIFRILPLFFFLGILSASGQSRCDSIPFNQLGYWVGHWNVYDTYDEIIGRSEIKYDVDNCVVVENWYGGKGSKGKSLNYYLPSEKKWIQKWIDNQSNPLEFEGEIKNDSLIHYAQTKLSNDSLLFHKMIIYKVSGDSVHQVWYQRKEHQPWKQVFDGMYVRQNDQEVEVNQVYLNFSRAYRTQNLHLLLEQYHEDAAYIFGKKEIVRGKDKIKKQFKAFFDDIKHREMEMTIEFKIVDRISTPTLVHDVGYYMLKYYIKGQLHTRNVGKFSLVLGRFDGRWQFASDTYIIAPVNEFIDASGIYLYHPEE